MPNLFNLVLQITVILAVCRVMGSLFRRFHQRAWWEKCSPAFCWGLRCWAGLLRSSPLPIPAGEPGIS